jgi:hypothetical protein
MNHLLNLGDLYVSDFLKPDQEAGEKYPLELVMDESIGAARLKTIVPTSKMFGKYWYRSGTNATMKAALKDIVDSIVPLVKPTGIWLDIACNDGTLLSYVPPTFTRYGIDPVEDSILDRARDHAHVIRQEYFTGIEEKASVVTSIAMFYDLEKPDKFIQDVRDSMTDDGLWVIQMSYTPLMLQQLAFDNICHEHVYYHTLLSMENLMERNGMVVVDCQLNDVNGGSFRLFIKKQGRSFATQPYSDVCNWRLNSIRLMEYNEELDRPKTWWKFFDDILLLKSKVTEFIQSEKSKGKSIAAYGASTKGNTLLQFFGLDDRSIDFIAERQQQKWGLRTVGTNIPIISEEEMRERNPDYLLMLPWHFSREFINREKDWCVDGGKWIIPCPKFEVLGLYMEN